MSLIDSIQLPHVRFLKKQAIFMFDGNQERIIRIFSAIAPAIVLNFYNNRLELSDSVVGQQRFK